MERRRISLLNRLMLLMIPMLLLVTIVLVFIPYYMRFRLRSEVVERDRGIIRRQVQEIDAFFRREDNFLVSTFQENGDINVLRRGSYPKDNANHMYAVRELFNSHRAQGDSCDLYFVLLRNKEQSRFAITETFSEADKVALEEFFGEFEVSEELQSVPWSLLVLDGQLYYIRYLSRNGVCIGGMIRATNILVEIDVGDSVKVLCDAEDQPITNLAWMEENSINVSNIGDEGYALIGWPDRYLALQEPFSAFEGSLLLFISDREVLGNLSEIIILLHVLSAISIIMMIFVGFYFYQTLNRSLRRLKNTITELKDENLESRVKTENASREFGEVYDLFNEMADRIKYLRIKSYEEEIARKNYQLQFYSLQIKPHFYLNSLKFMYALAQKEDYQSIQKMLLELSDYYQFITYDSEKLIPLEEELRHTATYIMIREAGVTKHTDCVLEIDNRARKCLVPGMSVQTFVENSLKYSGLAPEELIIRISVKLQEGEEATIRIIVTDNGKGYGAETLEAFSGDNPAELEGHAGLSNLWHRLKLIYEQGVSLRIWNLQSGGACSEIVLPIREPEEGSQ